MKKTMAAELGRRTGLVILTMLCLTPVCHAGVIFQTGFESSGVPSYSTGQLSGTNGWAGTTAAVVENSTVFSGLQAVSLDSAGLTGQNLVGQNLTYNSSTDPDQLVVFDIEFMESSSGMQSNWDPLNVGANGQVVAQIIVQKDGDAVLGALGAAVGSIAVSAGTWNDFRLVLDFQTQTVLFNNSDSDAIVSVVSQLNNLVSPSLGVFGMGDVHSPGVEKLGFNGPTELDDPAFGMQVTFLLNSPLGKSFKLIY
jgi:hypothetical protein